MSKQRTIQQVFEKWEYWTLRADGKYHRCEYKQASKDFSLSADILEPWLDREHPQFWQVVRLFVLSCHNSAQAFQKDGRIKEAEYYYRYAHFRLLGFYSKKWRKSAVFFDRLVPELRNTFDFLKAHLLASGKAKLALEIRQESDRLINSELIRHSKTCL